MIEKGSCEMVLEPDLFPVILLWFGLIAGLDPRRNDVRHRPRNASFKPESQRPFGTRISYSWGLPNALNDNVEHHGHAAFQKLDDDFLKAVTLTIETQCGPRA